MNIHKLYRNLMAITIAGAAASATAGILKLFKSDPPEETGQMPTSSPQEPEHATLEPATLNIVDSLALKGWLLATVPEGTNLSYSVVEGRTPLSVSDSIRRQFCHPLSPNDTLRPKRNCKIMLRAEAEGKSLVYTIISFDFCAFVETAIRSQDFQLAQILHQLFQSFSSRHPLLISYDYTVEDVCRDIGDRGLLDNFRMSLQSMAEGNVTYHIDSIRTYSPHSPMEEVLQTSYPPIEFINVNGNY